MAKEEDPFDSLLGLEDEFYHEGFQVGREDGKRAGLIDGRLYGLENGFGKYVTMGRLYGRARVWAGRMSSSDRTAEQVEGPLDGGTAKRNDEITARLRNPRLSAHVRTLYALTEPSSLATKNSEDAVADFDDRLKRAEGKFKVIQKLTSEGNQDCDDRPRGGSKGKGDGGIEDTSILAVRH